MQWCIFTYLDITTELQRESKFKLKMYDRIIKDVIIMYFVSIILSKPLAFFSEKIVMEMYTLKQKTFIEYILWLINYK